MQGYSTVGKFLLLFPLKMISDKVDVYIQISLAVSYTCIYYIQGVCLRVCKYSCNVYPDTHTLCVCTQGDKSVLLYRKVRQVQVTIV